ncbi:MAG: B12-binding domain-containing radical SAM protein [Melioribacteraceae bacterium]|nr:B12-binding domain-containing radical SAM protein [Melioribacteraceae bacterium]
MNKPIVILVYPKINHEKDYLYHWIPFSLLTIAKPIVESGNAEIIIFDENQSSLDEWDRLLEMYINRTICFGFSIMTGGGQIANALELIRMIKLRDATKLIVVGGPHVNVLPLQTLNHELIDVVLSGPGQNSFPHFIAALLNETNFSNVPGLIMKHNGGRIYGTKNEPRPKELGRYPWELLNICEYIRDDKTISSKTLNYVSSQGCIYKCQFCYELTYQRKYKEIDSYSLLDDIENLISLYGITGVKFYDADWFINLKRAMEFSQGIIKRNINLNWAASINPNDILRARKQYSNLLSVLAQSGCTRLLMGVESGSNRILNEVIKKEITKEKIVEVAKEIAKSGILGSYTFIIGFPGETKDEMNMTIDLIKELRELTPQPETRVHLFAPYPGTPLFDIACKHGFNPPTNLEGWSSFDYYDSQTPWTDSSYVDLARRYTLIKNIN